MERALNQWNALSTNGTRRGSFLFFFCIPHRKIVYPRMTRSTEDRATYIPRTLSAESCNRNGPFPPSTFLLCCSIFFLVREYRLPVQISFISMPVLFLCLLRERSDAHRLPFSRFDLIFLLLLSSTFIVAKVYG
jgi:hypothetical protein